MRIDKKHGCILVRRDFEKLLCKKILQIVMNSMFKWVTNSFFWFAQSQQNNYWVFHLFKTSKQWSEKQLSQKQPSEKQFNLSRVSKANFSTCLKSGKITTKFLSCSKSAEWLLSFDLFKVVSSYLLILLWEWKRKKVKQPFEKQSSIIWNKIIMNKN